MKISIIIPCYNENTLLTKVLERIFTLNLPYDKEIIIIDDGSDILQSKFIPLKNKSLIKYFRIPINQGKGFAIRVGLRYASGDIIIIQDADCEYDPYDIKKLINPILEKKCYVVYGSRFMEKKIKMTKFHYFGNKILTFFTNILYHTNLTDIETGYKIFSREVIDDIKLNSREFEIEPELTSKIILKNYKIIEIPIKYSYRKKYISKITFLDGIDSFITLLHYRFFPNSKLFEILYKIFKNYFKKKLNVILYRMKKFLDENFYKSKNCL
ncbi:MAG: glycosyltransferase family 2 protein [Promethearchaeota archaeon]